MKFKLVENYNYNKEEELSELKKLKTDQLPDTLEEYYMFLKTYPIHTRGFPIKKLPNESIDSFKKEIKRNLQNLISDIY